MDTESLSVSCCFTGHRATKLPSRGTPLYDTLRAATEDAVQKAYDAGYLYFYTGMCDGFDLMAAEIVLTLHESHPAVRLIGARPYPGFGETKSNPDRALLDIIMSRDSDTFTLIDVFQKYWRGCFHGRNTYMVDRSSLVIAAFLGGSGGTLNTIKYAQKEQKLIWNVCTSISPEAPHFQEPW